MAEFKEKGNQMYKACKYEEAVNAYSKAIEAEPKEATFFGNRAAALLMLKKYDEALEDCRQAIELDSAFVKGYVRGSKCLSQRGMFREARTMLSSFPQPEQGNAEVSKELELIEQLEKDFTSAQDHLKKNDYDRAGYFVDRLVAQCPDSPFLYTMRAELLIGRQRFDDASSICWALLAKDRQNPDLLFLRGKALCYGGSTEQAMKHFQEALRVDPDHARAREGLKTLKAMEKAKASGNTAFKEGKCADAIQYYTEALSYDPLNVAFNSTILCNRAATKMLQRNYKEALEDCDASLKLNSGYVKAITRRAECLIQVEQYEEAVREMERACQMEPENREYKTRLRDAKVELKKSLRKNYYKILEVGKDADENEVKKAYKRAALKFHPDKWANATDEEKESAEKAFKDIGEAYSVLSDPQKKRRYDAGQDIEEIEGGCGGGCHSEMDPNQIFQMFMNQGGGFGGGGFGGGGGGGMRFHFQ